MSSTTGSTPQSGSAVHRAAVLTHGRPEAIGPALARVEAAARDAGVELVFPQDEVSKHEIDEAPHDLADADLVLVLGGDGTMLRALQRFLGTEVPVIGVNFGRVGFFASIRQDELESGLARVFAGDYRVVPLTTLDAEAPGMRASAINDVVTTSSVRGRMVELRDPSGLRVRCFKVEGGVVSPILIDRRYEGPPGAAHGGIVAAYLDEVLAGAVVRATGRLAVTGELTVRYVRPVPLETPLAGRAQLVADRERYADVEGRIEDLATAAVLATARGRFVFMRG